MKTLILSILFVVSGVALSVAKDEPVEPAPTVVTFTYLGTDGENKQTTADGSFSFSNAGLTTVTLADLSSFSLHQVVSSSNRPVIGVFDFDKSNLVAFSISISNGLVVDATFETTFKPQTSSPTGTDFKPQRFLGLTATEAVTQYREQFAPPSIPPTNDTSGILQFSTVPEPSSACFLLSGVALLTLRRHRAVLRSGRGHARLAGA